jgi:hypothetical protein
VRGRRRKLSDMDQIKEEKEVYLLLGNKSLSVPEDHRESKSLRASHI